MPPLKVHKNAKNVGGKQCVAYTENQDANKNCVITLILPQMPHYVSINESFLYHQGEEKFEWRY